MGPTHTAPPPETVDIDQCETSATGRTGRRTRISDVQSRAKAHVLCSDRVPVLRAPRRVIYLSYQVVFKKMRIGINALSLQGIASGFARYLSALCVELDSLLPDAEFFLYARLPISSPVDSPRWQVRTGNGGIARRLKNALWLKTLASPLCREDRLDVFWGLDAFLPSLPPSVRKVVTVHDLVHVLYPETMAISTLIAHRLFFKRDLDRADAVITTSRATAKRLQEHYGRRADAVVSPSIASHFRSSIDAAEISRVQRRYGLGNSYLLTVSTWEPRKNQELLIHTIGQMKRDGLLPGMPLALAGGRGWKDQRLAQLVEKAKQEGVVKPLGFVDDRDLPALYAGAAAFVFPSLYEGYGNPAAEAVSCGTRVVATDLPEIREAAGSRPIYIQPTQKGIREGILRALAMPASGRPGETEVPTWRQRAEILAAVFRGTGIPAEGKLVL